MPMATAQNEIQQHYAPRDNFTPPTREIVIMHQTVSAVLGRNPVKMACPSCHTNIKTTTVSDHQPTAHICCIILCIIGWGFFSLFVFQFWKVITHENCILQMLPMLVFTLLHELVYERSPLLPKLQGIHRYLERLILHIDFEIWVLFFEVVM